MNRKSIFIQERDEQSYNLLFDIEAFLRTLVRWESRGIQPKDWTGLINKQVLTTAKDRQKQERSLGYVDGRKSGILSYLTLSELKDILLGPLWERCIRINWPPQEIVKSEFKKLIAIRNKVAHFRPVTEKDMRVSIRFGEDLVDWTDHYRRLRKHAVRLKWNDETTSGNIKNIYKEGVLKFWKEIQEQGTVKRYRIDIAILGHHVSLSAKPEAGSIDSELFLEFVDKFEKLVSFYRVGKLGEKVCCYIPLETEDHLTLEIFRSVISLVSDPGKGMSSEEAQKRYELSERENILPWAIDLPTEFRL